MKEKYYKIKKEIAARGGFTPVLREEIDDSLLLSDKDMSMITLTTEEKLAAIGGTEYIKRKTKK